MTYRQTRLPAVLRDITQGMIRGLYRMRDRLLGAAVRIHWTGGDAAPVLSEKVYAAMGGVPELIALPTRDEYRATNGMVSKDPLELA
jgi:hypothetical protein